MRGVARKGHPYRDLVELIPIVEVPIVHNRGLDYADVAAAKRIVTRIHGTSLSPLSQDLSPEIGKSGRRGNSGAELRCLLKRNGGLHVPRT